MRKTRTNPIIAAVLTLVVTSLCSANLVVNGGFEVYEDTDGPTPPTTYGDWTWDDSEIVSASEGITPFEGNRMLQFRGASPMGASSSANTCTVAQLIDISSFTDLIASGNAIALVSGYFNRVVGDEQTDTLMGVSLRAVTGSPSSFPSMYNDYIAYNSGSILSDSDILTWELIEFQLEIPVNTDYLALVISCGENIYNDGIYPEFDGHFADSISVQIVPEPATIVLLGLGLGIFMRSRK